MNNHWWTDYKDCTKNICKPKYAEYSEEEYKLVLDWVKQNQEEAANFILNVITEKMENEIDFESHYVPLWFKIKGIKKPLRPIQTINENVAPVVLDKINNKEDLDELLGQQKKKGK